MSDVNILRSIRTVLYNWDLLSDRLHWGAGVEAVLNLGSAEAIATGRDYADLVAPQSMASRHTAIHNASGTDSGEGVPYEVVYGLVSLDRNVIWVEDIGRWFAGADGRPQRAQGAVRLVGERCDEGRRLSDGAQFDRLTGAMSREALFGCLTRMFSMPREQRKSVAVLLLALDRLGQINRSYGYDVADALLVGTIRRLRENLRATDILARFTGNTFAIVLNACNAERMEATAHRLLGIVAATPIATPIGGLRASMRIGGLVDPRSARSPEAFMRHAEEALHRAQRPGSPRFVSAPAELSRDGERARTLEVANDIVTAVNSRELLLACQPIVATNSRQPAFHEAFARIVRADGSILLPGDFLPTAEEIGLVQLIDRRVLELALAHLAAEPALTLSINVSVVSALEPEWPSEVAELMSLHPEVRGRLMIELAESDVIANQEAIGRVIASLKSQGIRFAIDRFGTGRGSAAELRRLSVDFLKIDGSLLRDAVEDDDAAYELHALYALGRHLGLPVVAQWVETAAAAELSLHCGASYLQGHLLGRPATAASFLPGLAVCA